MLPEVPGANTSRPRANSEINDRIDEEIARIDLVEKKAWAAFDKSQQDLKEESETEESSSSGTTKRKTSITREQCGDPRYLQIVLKCVEKRLRLMGLYKYIESPEIDNQNKAVGVLVVVETYEEAQKILSYSDFEIAKQMAEAKESQDLEEVESSST